MIHAVLKPLFALRPRKWAGVAAVVGSALMGRFVGWGKSDRKATVLIAAE